jgi:drug/metabolite transporter (DMT)-like permease
MAAVCSVYGWILLRQMTSTYQVSPLLANGYSMLIGGGIALGHSLLVEQWDPIPVTNMNEFILSATGLIIVSNLMAYNLYGYLLRRYTATFMSFAGFTTPLFAAVFGWFFLGEEITWSFVVSFVIVSSGLYLFYQEELHRVYHGKILLEG